MKRNEEVDDQILEDNYKVFAMASRYLNQVPDLINGDEVREIAAGGVSEEYAFGVILAAAFGLDVVDHAGDRELFRNYFERMVRKLEVEEYSRNSYYQTIRFPAVKNGDIELKYESYKPYEGFVWNDIVRTREGRQIPQIGFFGTEFRFPAILERGRIWMTITPNEIETMKEPLNQAFGHVLTFGLGLGYFAYMASEKATVERVTVVEANREVIQLFKKHILPQFKHADKVEIIQADAFDYAEKHLAQEKYDFVFTDLWHDVSDGLDLYGKMKQYEKLSPETVFTYWIEKSILCYL